MIGAFLIGLVGSLHCLGMCGPIMITFVGPRQSALTFVLYHGGRLISYMLIGFSLGSFGASLNLLHFQQWGALILGVLLIAIYLKASWRNAIERRYFQSALYKKISGLMSANLSLRKRWMVSGLANGFLPCGLTYVAAAGAVSQSSILLGAGFMTFFGLGTLPAFVFLAVGGNLAGDRWKKWMPGAVSVVAVISGALLFLRGALMTFPDFNMLVRDHAVSLITICGMN